LNRRFGASTELTQCDDKSLITRDVLVNLRKRFLKHGCIVEDYTITNPTAIENIIKLRMASGLEHSTLDYNLFADRRQAIESIHHVLLKLKDKSANSE